MKREKIAGALYGAAYGDSYGAITEFCSRSEIKNAFPAGRTEYTESISGITHGIVPGTVTDDFGSSCYFMQTIIKHKGAFDRTIAIEAVLEWAKDEIVFGKYAGQNTKSAIEHLKQGIVIDEMQKKRHFGRQNTNGGAMKAAPMGLLACESQDEAIRLTKAMCWPTHYNSAAVSGACAIACAVCEAQSDQATLDSIFEKAIKGAKCSRLQLEAEGFEAFGPFVDERIRMAVDLGKKVQGDEAICELLNGQIGTGITVQESIPAVFAIIAACGQNLEHAICCASMAGGDTDTISTMIGAILGGYFGLDAIREEHINRIQTANEFLQLKETIEQFTELVLVKKGELS